MHKTYITHTDEHETHKHYAWTESKQSSQTFHKPAHTALTPYIALTFQFKLCQQEMLYPVTPHLHSSKNNKYSFDCRVNVLQMWFCNKPFLRISL